MRRAWRAGLGTAAGIVVVAALPAAASAHGLVQRPPLPIPQWLFGWSAAAVLVISFFALAVLWPQARLEHDTWRALPGGRVLGGRAVQALCGAIGVGLLVTTILAGYLGNASALDNFAPTFVMITFWVGLVFVSIVFGDVFRAFSPWRALGRVLPSLHRPFPERLGRWPAAVGLFAFVWVELVSEWSTDPPMLAGAALGYTVVTLVAQGVYGVETWSRRGEAFAVYFNLFARMSPFETRDGVVGVRRPLAGLTKLDHAPGTIAFLCVMIGTVSFDGLSQGSLWQSLGTTSKVAGTLGLLLGVLVVAGFYRLGLEGARSVGGGHSVRRLGTGFAHSLVPIAAVYVAAHYLTFLLFEGQAIGYLASDPFGQGWDLFGTVDSGIDYTIFPQENTWYLQVAVVVLGHVAGLVLAHDRALTLYRDGRLAVRSQYWMLGVMVGFTSLALWLLAQAG
jgi:hypothetical protein